MQKVLFIKGLASDKVYQIIIGENDQKWIGTEDGLNKFDGYSFTKYKFEPENKNRVEDYIQSRTEKHGYHGDFGITLGPYEVACRH